MIFKVLNVHIVLLTTQNGNKITYEKVNSIITIY